MLFHEVYSKYYYAIAQILTQTHNKPLSQKEIEDNIVKKNTFKETYLYNDFFKNKILNCFFQNIFQFFSL